jgi:hypothetical protein
MSKRFARPGYHPARSLSRNRLQPRSPVPSTFHRTGFHPTSGSQISSAIVPIDNPGPGFYSHIFVVPKKQKGFWRLIIDLSRLSRFLRVPHFKIEIIRRPGSIIGPTGCVSSRPRTSRLPALSSILLRRSSIPVQGYASLTGLCSADISVNRKGVCSTATYARTKTSFLFT